MKQDRPAAVITGGATGIGYACAAALLERGFNVLICGRRPHVLTEAQESLSRITEDSDRARIFTADIRREAASTAIIESCVDEFGRIDALINNAAIVVEVPFLELTGKAWDETFQSNLRGPGLLSLAAAKQMISARSGGRIVHIASVNGFAAEPHLAHYNASKAGLMSLTQSMAVDLARFGIQTNAVAPGWVHTPLTTSLVEELTPEVMKDVNPAGRVGHAEEIGEVAAYLCSEAPSFLTGCTIVIDGGQLAMAHLPRIGTAETHGL